MIKIGTCGYGYYSPVRGWKEKYKSKLQAFSQEFKTCEINKTFYKLPMTKTLYRWREEVAEDFEFTLKAWQAITHPTNSPTWRKYKQKLSPEQLENFGNFRPNKEVIEAWKETKERAEALQAKICIFQTSGKFNWSEKNEKNMRKFFSEIDRENLELAWEPRGDWNQHLDKVKHICDSLGLIHIVDLMRREPVSKHPLTYIRLHGLNPKEYDYNYDYSKEELKELAGKLKKLNQKYQTVYCMFNNYEMFNNARRLMEIL